MIIAFPIGHVAPVTIHTKPYYTIRISKSTFESTFGHRMVLTSFPSDLYGEKCSESISAEGGTPLAVIFRRRISDQFPELRKQFAEQT
jgi:hypothetical protein